MMADRIYLDWNATAPLRPEARSAMFEAFSVCGNPSSVHAEGRAAKALIERSRGRIAEALGCKAKEVVFVSGATEAAQVLSAWPGPVLVDPTAHDALWAQRREASVGPSIFAFGLANSETGAITPKPSQPSDATCIDLTQAVGRIPVAFGWGGADLGIVSAHKFGGPKGIGALIVKEGLDIEPLALGGGQEMGRRAGTENVVGIAGFAAALDAVCNELESGIWNGVKEKRRKMEEDMQALVPDCIVAGGDLDRLPNTSCIVVPGWKGETQVMQMDLAGFAISAGSACSSGKVSPSRVLASMGYDDDQSASAIRVSFGPEISQDALDEFVTSWSRAYERHRARAA
jgi:cysteine desulfurase